MSSMRRVCFLHRRPRAVKKAGPLLAKRGLTVEEVSLPEGAVSSGAPDGGPAAVPPWAGFIEILGGFDVVVIDSDDGLNLAAALLRGAPGLKGRVVVVAASPPDAPEGLGFCAPGGVVEAVLQAAGQGPRGLEAIIADKKRRLAELRRRGVDPYPHRWSKKDPVASITASGAPLGPGERSGRRLSTAGRVVSMRVMGRTAFAHLQDGSGRAQVYIRLDDAGPEAFRLFTEDAGLGDFIGVEGEAMKTRTGEPTLSVRSVTLLAKALRPLPEKWHGLKDIEARYRRRHLDLASNPEVRALFESRSRIVDSIRGALRDLGYIEVETPVLLPQAGGASATPFTTRHRALGADMFLRIATELYLKRLIIGGFERVFEIGRIFRNEGIDTRHNPEFTMLEAYAAYEDYHAMAALVERLFDDCRRALGQDEVDYRGRTLGLKPPFPRLRLGELWRERCGDDIHAVLKGKGFDRAALLALASRLGVAAGQDTPSAKVFERIFDARILGLLEAGAFVLDHPTAITPLAKCLPGDESLVERFEFFLGGEEIANAYTELNDPEDQRERLEEQRRQREAGDQEADLLDEDFIEAMECGMPPTGGIGIGIDRLVMVLTGHPSIREVILFPTLKPGEAP